MPQLKAVPDVLFMHRSIMPGEILAMIFYGESERLALAPVDATIYFQPPGEVDEPYVLPALHDWNASLDEGGIVKLSLRKDSGLTAALIEARQPTLVSMIGEELATELTGILKGMLEVSSAKKLYFEFENYEDYYRVIADLTANVSKDLGRSFDRKSFLEKLLAERDDPRVGNKAWLRYYNRRKPAQGQSRAEFEVEKSRLGMLLRRSQAANAKVLAEL